MARAVKLAMQASVKTKREIVDRIIFQTSEAVMSSCFRVARRVTVILGEVILGEVILGDVILGDVIFNGDHRATRSHYASCEFSLKSIQGEAICTEKEVTPATIKHQGAGK